MGSMQRNKGKSFEQKIADLYRKEWPGLTVRRSLQAHRPHEPDVVVEGPSGIAGSTPLRLWSECNDAAKPNPRNKLAQAERDIAKAVAARVTTPGFYLPVVVWHQLRSRDIHVTTRLWVLLDISPTPVTATGDTIVTVALRDFLDLCHHQ